VFRHTVEKRRGLTHIAVSARREGDALVLRVDDDGRLDENTGAGPDCGIGLANLRARLAALHGARASLSLAARGGGVRAEMRLPCAS